MNDVSVSSPGAPITISSSLCCWEVDGSGKACAEFLREIFLRVFFVLVRGVEEVAVIVDACVTTMVLKVRVCRYLEDAPSQNFHWSHMVTRQYWLS